MGNELSFQRLFDLVKTRYRTYIVVGIMAAVLAIVFSLPVFIKPRYKSTATVYPVNLNSYSIETRTDQLLQLLQSNSIRDSLIRKFDLSHAYRVDTTLKGGYYALYNEFLERVEISKTKYESVMIEVVDEDAVRARDMVNAMLYQVNQLARRLQREKSYEVLRIAERTLGHERQKLDSVESRLNELRQSSGMLSYETQAKELTKGYVKLLSSNAGQAQRDKVLGMIKELESRGGEFRQLTEMSNIFRGNYDRALTQYEVAVNDVTKELTYTNVIVYPEVADKKVYPVRWLIVLLATASALVLCTLVLLWQERR
ncbi:MAG TPA: Wzz/FepE/Etk N-terminal domain-containing protein [Flavobacteriales bacterium]|nr:Wzz/FepE/Etk N-terminal domain-containing protein [Flavobacteriales bacterium]HNU55750.1 Wzz/FepE/Etk N-terminal domain-containing protein [Flavobacteriales bacterium]